MSISFIDLNSQYKRIESRIKENMNRVLEHGAYINGPEIEKLEEKLSAFCGSRYAVACSSGTDALLLALRALNVRPGDALLTTPFTFCATAETIALLGAVPIFIDIDPQTHNLDPHQIEKALKAVQKNDPSIHPLPRNGFSRPLTVKGIVSVDLFGLPCDYDSLMPLARENDLYLIVDAAQSLGSLDKDKSPCSLGTISCTSFFPAKPLGCYGDGGMCFTQDSETADVLRSLRVHGRREGENLWLGMNARMATLQAAVLLAKSEIFPEELRLRRELAWSYNQLLYSVQNIATPPIFQDKQSAWAQYSIQAEDSAHREQIFRGLKEQGIPWAIYYPHPLHLEPALRYLGYRKGDFPVSESTAERIFSLPMHPYLHQEDQERIVETIAQHA